MAHTILLDENKLHQVVTASNAVECRKRSFSALIVNTTGSQLTYRTRLRSGETEVASATLPPGFTLAVQPGGEVNVLIDTKGRDTRANLYVAEELSFDDAKVKAEVRGAPLPTPELVEAAIAMLVELNPGTVTADFEGSWAEHKGHVRAIRFRLVLPKAAWGGEQVIETVFITNLLAPGDAYKIDGVEFGANWFRPDMPLLTGDELVASLPVLEYRELVKMCF